MASSMYTMYVYTLFKNHKTRFILSVLLRPKKVSLYSAFFLALKFQRLPVFRNLFYSLSMVLIPNVLMQRKIILFSFTYS